MMGLWADGWFYISSAGLLVSGILFFFLLGQYRVASEAADVTDGEQGADKEVSVPAPSPIRPVYIPDDVPAARISSHSDKPEAQAEYAGPDRRKDAASTTTGGISPAVVYLQNIKVELADLHKDLRALAQRVDAELAAVSTRDEALISRLGELASAIENLKAASPAVPAMPEPEPEPAPSPKKARKVEKAPEPAPVVLTVAPEPEPVPEPAPEPVPEPKTEPAIAANETIRMELGALIAAPLAQEASAAQEPQPEQAAASPEPPPEEKPRRGPVWPV